MENGVRLADFAETSKYTKVKFPKFLSLQNIQMHFVAIYILQNLRNFTTFCDKKGRLICEKMAQLTPHTSDA